MSNGKIYPPKWVLKFLKWFCPAHHLEEIEGDLLQRFYSDVKRAGVGKANRRLIWNTIKFFRPEVILRNRISIQLNHFCLLRAYVILAARTMARNKAFSLINISGLSASIVVAVLILLYVRFELSYDDFHHRAENIYRVSTKVTLQNELINHETNTYEGISKALKENFSGVQVATSIYAFNSDKNFIRYEDDQKKLVPIQTFKALNVDSNFFKLFSFPLVAGNPNVVLKDAYSALISDTFSKQYFLGNPVGRILEVYDGEERTRYKITGMLKDIPFNSHVKFDLIIRGNEKDKNFLNDNVGFWDWGSQTYILLHDSRAATDIESKLNAFALSNNGLKKNKDDYGQASTFELQPLRDIHLNSHLSEEFEANGSGVLVYALIALASIIIIIAWINYINLSTAVADDKMKSIGVRKVIGASRIGLITQVLTEAGVFNTVAVAIAIALIHILFPFYADAVGMPMDYSTLYNLKILAGLVGFIFFSTLAAGSYPAIMISALNPIRSVTRGVDIGNKFTLRKSLVVFQFFSATALMIITGVAIHQLSYMRTKELGLDIDKVIVVKALNFDKETWSDRQGGYVIDSAYQQKLDLFKEHLRADATFANVTAISHLPGQLPNWGSEFKVPSIDPSKAYRLLAMGVDYDFLSTFKVKLLAGRYFSEDFHTDRGNEGKRAVLINETACRLLGFKTPSEAVHSHVATYWGADYEIIGVVNSFHQLSLKENLEPIYFMLQPRALPYYAVNFKGEDVQHVVGQLQTAWKQHFPDYPFDFFFLDEFYNRQYQSDQKFSNIMGVFSGLAVFMACLGLFGLTSYAIVRRTKEIGIRKVLGATLRNVIGLFTRDFSSLILLANVLAIPLAYFGIDRWLENYPFKIPLAWWHFALPAVLLLTIALITIGLQTIKVSLRNPVESLRYE